MELKLVKGDANLGKFELWMAIVYSMARIAPNAWNLESRNPLIFPEVFNIEVVFISSVNAPRYRTKSILWTLQAAFAVYSQERFYTSAIIRTYVGEGADARNLGVARFRFPKKPLATDSQRSSSTSPLGNDTTLSMTSPTNQSLVPGITFPTAPSDSQNGTDLQAKGLQLTLTYTQGGASFDPQGFFKTIMILLIFAAQHDPSTEASGVVADYNERDNYTVAISPMSAEAREDLPWDRAIPVLRDLPRTMLGEQRGGRWAELEGRARVDGVNTARVKIVTGDLREELRALYGDPNAAVAAGGASDQGIDPCDLLANDTASS